MPDACWRVLRPAVLKKVIEKNRRVDLLHGFFVSYFENIHEYPLQGNGVVSGYRMVGSQGLPCGGAYHGSAERLSFERIPEE